MRTLLVCDQGPLAQELGAALQRLGLEVEHCERADEAVSAWETTPPALALVVLDDSPRARSELLRALQGLPGGEELVTIGVGRGLPDDGVAATLDDWLVLPLRRGETELRLGLATRLADRRRAGPATQETTPPSPAVRSGEADALSTAREADKAGGISRTLRALLRGLLPRPDGVAAPRPAEAAEAPGPVAIPMTPSPVATDTPPPLRVAGPSSAETAPAGAPDGLWDWDLLGHLVTFSPQVQALRGFAAEEVVTSEEEFFELVHPHDRESLRQAVAAHLDQRTLHFESEHRLRLQDGSYGWMLARGIAFRDAFGKAVRMVGSQGSLNRRTGLDPITGMYNRAYFLVRLARALEASRVPGCPPFAVLFFNLDRFKNVNYTLGHRVGDQLLAAVAGRLRDCLRVQDIEIASFVLGAHLGADEFAILHERIADTSDPINLAKRIQESLRQPFVIEGHELFVTTCIGIATSERPSGRPEDLLRDADAAAHQARALGRTTYAVFQESMHDDAAHVLRLENDLRRAVQRNEFRVYYQPIVLLSQGSISGFEALVRWQHPSGRLIMPVEFIPLAEEIGIITDIDHWVLNEVCRQLRVWETQFHRRPPLTVAVNLSGVEFQKPEIMTEIDRALRTHGIWGRNLKIEITESVIMEHARYAADMLAHLRALDIRLSIDDFGTGYSSLSYLKRFEIDLLKIDKSFVGRMDTDQDSEEIVRTIITLAKNLGKEVVAEGVERRRQLDQLVALGCMFGQGYFFSRPVDASAAGALLAEEARGLRILRP
ncbi:MAG TPA: EAL domain-containing protein [Thermoanaerobaculaceae bacterium]|nr:EAL domain-containing protein [Thermoanaerobaculaceae bacterium]